MFTHRSDRHLLFKELCFVDVETTGPIFGYHEIIDIGAIRSTHQGTETGHWSCRLRPKHPDRLTDTARRVNGYSEELWSSERIATKEVWSSFVEFAQGCIPVAHNPSFDRAFLTLAAADTGIDDLLLDYHWLGTESLAWPLYLKGALTDLSLSAICDFVSVTREPDPHTGLAGARVCMQAYFALLQRLVGSVDSPVI